jgi:hypothetical protein
VQSWHGFLVAQASVEHLKLAHSQHFFLEVVQLQILQLASILLLHGALIHFLPHLAAQRIRLSKPLAAISSMPSWSVA